MRPAVVPILLGRSGRTVGVVWRIERNSLAGDSSIKGLVRLGMRLPPPWRFQWCARPTARVDRLSMGLDCSISPKGFAVPKGRPDRRFVVVHH